MTRPNRNHGFTLAEMLLALVISAMLLAAIATAMHASLMSYKENEKVSTVTQTARSILSRMTRDIRTAEAINYIPGVLTIIPPDVGSDVTIQYTQTGSGLSYRITKDGVSTTQALVAGTDDVQIDSFTVTEETGLDWEGYTCTKSLAMQIVFLIDGQRFPIAATARPRRNIVY